MQCCIARDRRQTVNNRTTFELGHLAGICGPVLAQLAQLHDVHAYGGNWATIRMYMGGPVAQLGQKRHDLSALEAPKRLFAKRFVRAITGGRDAFATTRKRTRPTPLVHAELIAHSRHGEGESHG